MGAVHEPSLPMGEVKPMTTNLAPNVGPMVCGHPVITLPSSTPISWYRAAAQHLTSKVTQKSISLTEKQQLNIWHFTGTWLPNFRQHSTVTLCALSIQTVPVDEGEDSAKITIRGHWGPCQAIHCVLRRNNSRRPDFMRRKTHPRRTATPKERGNLRHPCGSRSAVFVNSAHRVSTSVNIQKCPGACDHSICQGHVTFWMPGAWTFV